MGAAAAARSEDEKAIPQLSSATPSSGPGATATDIALVGTNLTADMTVQFGAFGTRTLSSFEGPTGAHVITRADLADVTVDLTPANSVGTGAPLVGGYRFKAITPTVISVDQSTATVGATIDVNGTNFAAAGAPSNGEIEFKDSMGTIVAGTNYQFDTNEHVQANVPSGLATGLLDVRAKNDGGTSAWLDNVIVLT